jgi:YhcH/YjgK/YiaL family protein
MIYDLIENIHIYSALTTDFKKAIEIICTVDLNAAEPGTYHISGSEMYYNVMDSSLVGREDTRWECHDKYIDIQYAVSGCGERIDYAPRADFTDFVIDLERDIAFSGLDPAHTTVDLRAGSFAVFFPQDAHRPNQGCGTYRKVVFKLPSKK